jgi:protein-disulfide isomerase
MGDRKKQIWGVAIFLVVIVVITIIAAFASSSASQSSSTPSDFATTTTAAITSSDHTRGDANAKVTLIEYGDFECPACGAYEPLVEQLYQQYGSQVLFVFRNFPLYQIHPFAMIAAQAAEAANLQGKYWEMHDLLYKDQADWTANTTLTPAQVVSQYFDAYATQLGLNVTQFNTDINSTAVKNVVQNDITLGNDAQVNHTPTFFINLTQIPNPNSYAQFQSDIEAALAAATSSAQ